MFDEDFARWRDDPVTLAVFRALSAAEQAQRATWDAYSWGGNMVRPDELAETLKELRVRADCYRALQELTAEQVKEWLGIDDAE